MPIYQFRCPSCNTEFEGQQPRDETQGLKCPGCGSTARRLIGGGGGFRLKHTGQECHGERPTDGSCRRERTGVTCCGAKEPCGNPGSGRHPQKGEEG